MGKGREARGERRETRGEEERREQRAEWRERREKREERREKREERRDERRQPTAHSREPMGGMLTQPCDRLTGGLRARPAGGHAGGKCGAFPPRFDGPCGQWLSLRPLSTMTALS